MENEKILQKLDTPVVFIVFNRPETTQQVIDAIRLAQPSKLFIIADGPREDNREDIEKVTLVRSIIDQVNWPCDVSANYAEVNLGCKKRVSSGLNWVFAQVERAIILEDDCLPHPSFFRFCEEMLAKYSKDEKIMHISGDNFQFGRRYGGGSYYFSRYAHVWGWATWKRAWQNYDVDLKRWLFSDKKKILRDFSSFRERYFWRKTLDNVMAGKIDTWDFQWAFTCMERGALAIIPNVNLVSNIGFGADATHTENVSRFSKIPTEPMEFPLVHPESIARNRIADSNTSKLFFQNRGLLSKVLRKLKHFINRKTKV